MKEKQKERVKTREQPPEVSYVSTKLAVINESRTASKTDWERGEREK